MRPELPAQPCSLSYWHRTTRAFPHLNANRHADVPSSTQYLIIGSGISGSLTAWKLIESGVPGADIVILEAREAVSGATGRNAGHVRPDAFRGFTHFSSIHGPKQAIKILENEREVLEKVKEFVAENNIDCEFRFSSTMEVCLTPTYAEFQAQTFETFRAAGGDVSHIKYHEAKEARELTNIPWAECAYEWPAGSNHPGKLCQWILNDVIDKGVRLWTHCPAIDITAHDVADSTNLRWDVSTPRGVISAVTVVHCTNAYAGNLLPQFADIVTPRRTQVHSFVPNSAFSGDALAEKTISLRYGIHNFFSFNQLCNGTIIMGGTGIKHAKELTPEKLQSWVTFDDTGYDDKVAENSLTEFTKLSFAGEPPEAGFRPGEGLDHAWTGILGMTPDAVPYIGAIPSLDGQWICAGFNGHGMARIFTCAPGLVKLMSGESWADTGLPECFQLTQDRLNRLLDQRKAEARL